MDGLLHRALWSIGAGPPVGHPHVVWAIVGAGVSTVLVLLARGQHALRQLRAAHEQLQAAYLVSEQARDRAERVVAEQDVTIARLSDRNVVLTATHTVLGAALELADERSDGELRSRLEETASDLVEWLPIKRAEES